MKESWYVDCANCGKQVSIDGLASICYWCHKNATKKEDIMQEKRGTLEEKALVPTRPKKRKQLWAYFEQNKEAILADYHSMKLLEFFKSWGITSASWLKLKKLWGVQNKGKGTGPKTVKRPSADDTQGLTEHERYLILVGYQMAIMDFLKVNPN